MFSEKIYFLCGNADLYLYSPSLKSSNVFGAITGVITEQGGDKPDEAGQIPSISAIREQHVLQDMYRSILAASYFCPQGELPPDELIEDIFAGGDGFRGRWRPTTPLYGGNSPDKVHQDPDDALRRSRETMYREAHKAGFGRHLPNDEGNMSNSEWRRKHSRQTSEFDARSDLRSWTISREKYK